MTLSPKPAPPPERHLVAGPTIGYRLWRAEGGLLRGVSQQEIWRPRQAMIGACRRGFDWGPTLLPTHAEPHHLCACGLYALNQPDFAGVDYLEPYAAYVAGRVALWGRVIEHRLGYRAQYGYPEALWPYGWLTNMPALQVLGEIYGVPVYPTAPDA